MALVLRRGPRPKVPKGPTFPPYAGILGGCFGVRIGVLSDSPRLRTCPSVLHAVARLLPDDPLRPSKWNDELIRRRRDLRVRARAADQDRTGIISLEG